MLIKVGMSTVLTKLVTGGCLYLVDATGEPAAEARVTRVDMPETVHLRIGDEGPQEGQEVTVTLAQLRDSY